MRSVQIAGKEAPTLNGALKMGVLADVYLATPEGALAYDENPRPFSEVTVSAKGIMDLELSMLWAIYRGVAWDVEMLKDFRQLLIRDGGERIIAEIPDSLATYLADSDEAQISRISSAWAATEEMARYSQHVASHLSKLVELAKVARISGKRMYLWMCV